MFRFILGAIVGGAVVWFYGPRVRGYVDQTARTVRTRAADTLQSAAETLQSAKQAVEGGGSATAAGGMTGSTIVGGPERRAI